MSTIAYEPRESTVPTLLRLAAIICLVLLLHVLPTLFFVIRFPPPEPEPDEAVTLNFDDTPAASPPEVKPAAPPEIAKAVLPEAEKKEPLAARVVEQTHGQPTAGLPVPHDAPKAEKKELTERELEPLVEKPTVAFDEGKALGKPPADVYLSDRNSSAADRGPKNLPKGDPYVDKGQTDIIKYLQKRGEGNLPDFAEAAKSGSAKIEGAPNPGEGAPARQLPSNPLPPKQPIAETQRTDGSSVVGRRSSVTAPPPTIDQPPLTENDGLPVTLPTPTVDDGRQIPDLARNEKAAAPAPAPTTDHRPPATGSPAAELQAFAALLDTASSSQLSGRPGALNRKGERGHEGDGTLHPGNDDAVSDVTNFNLSTSAEDSDEARFAKQADPFTTYVKPLFRRTDGKWKAEIEARARWRPVRGIVEIELTVRKDGTLLSAQEVHRTDGLSDEYVAMAKKAVELAADPTCGPFPPELASRDKLVFSFSFLY